jgi:FKBP-type peptidyl-prolyl cis-trans isomerase FkpA
MNRHFFQKRSTLIALTLACGLGLSACGGGGSSTGTPADATGSANVTTLKTTDTAVGTGATVALGQVVTVNYTGWLYDVRQADTHGSKFDSSVGGAPFSFTLGAGQVIKGWDQGIVGMKVGGKRTLLIPSSLGYGASGSGPIPPNAALVFDVEVLSVK